MPRLLRILLLVVAGATAVPAIASGQDKTLTEGRPLLHLGDAFPIAVGEGAVLVGGGVTFQRAGPNRGFFPVAVQYGVLPRTQVSLGTTLSSHPHLASDPHAGDLTAAARVTFGRETPLWPSFAAQVSVTAPTGVGPRATDFELKLYATKTLSRSIFVHLNAAADVTDHPGADEGRARYRLALGPALPVPALASVLVAGDVFTEQSARTGEPNTTGLEAGIRVRLTPAIYWDAGIGSELWGPRDRADFFATTGVTIGFGTK